MNAATIRPETRIDVAPHAEVMAPVGSWECLAAALRAGADSVYFGVEQLNMRAHSANHFSINDLREIARRCSLCRVKTYLTVNTIIYDAEIALMHDIVDAAVDAGISAVIASDIAVMRYCRERGMEVHLSTQLNISNTEALRFFSQYADVAVLARELSLDQVATISENIRKERITGPRGDLVCIEMFCHGALCMAVSGKCYLSLDNTGRSANRGECMQLCRRTYTATDAETGCSIDIDNKYLMSPKDLKTIRFLDRMLAAGVSVLKIEGRARGPEYVAATVGCYKEAVAAIADGTFTEAKKDAWDARLAAVFNRGFWDGYYLGRTLGEWNTNYGSSATQRKVYAGKVVKYFGRIGVAEVQCEAADFALGEAMMATGPTTGALRFSVDEIRFDERPALKAVRGQRISMPVPAKVRPGDKIFKIVNSR